MVRYEVHQALRLLLHRVQRAQRGVQLPYFIKSKYPELIERYNIPLDEYPRRCVNQINGWEKECARASGRRRQAHERSREYASYIMEAMVTKRPYKIGGNVLNTRPDRQPARGTPAWRCPAWSDGYGRAALPVGDLPVQCAAMNMTNINVQLLTIEAARTRKKEHIYQAAMLDPHTGSELDVDTIRKMVDDLIVAHGDYLPSYR